MKEKGFGVWQRFLLNENEWVIYSDWRLALIEVESYKYTEIFHYVLKSKITNLNFKKTKKIKEKKSKLTHLLLIPCLH